MPTWQAPSRRDGPGRTGCAVADNKIHGSCEVDRGHGDKAGRQIPKCLSALGNQPLTVAKYERGQTGDRPGTAGTRVRERTEDFFFFLSVFVVGHRGLSPVSQPASPAAPAKAPCLRRLNCTAVPGQGGVKSPQTKRRRPLGYRRSQSREMDRGGYRKACDDAKNCRNLQGGARPFARFGSPVNLSARTGTGAGCLRTAVEIWRNG